MSCNPRQVAEGSTDSLPDGTPPSESDGTIVPEVKRLLGLILIFNSSIYMNDLQVY